MPNSVSVNARLFDQRELLRVRSVELRKTDSLQSHREKLARILLDDMYQFVALLDVQGTLLEVNRAALDGGGIRLQDIQGKPFWEARWWQVSPDTVQRQREVCARAAQGEFIRYDVEVYGSNGGDETIIIDYSLFPVQDNEGEVVFLLAEGRNITEKKKADAEIARKNEELEQLLGKVRELDEIKSQFFANVSHELRTPLALILGPVERVLAEAADLAPAHRSSLQVVRRNASTLLKQVNNLLDISKLDADKMQVSYAKCDLARLARMIGAHFDSLAPDRDIRFVIEAPESMPAEVDPDKVERVILNLLSNAFKFTPPGGRVRLALQAIGDDRAIVSVQDSGPGVRADQRGLIFERFRQSDGAANREFGGTGLGLSIAKDFVHLHGGTIGVTDAPGSGALFQVELPRKAPPGWHVRLLDCPPPQETGADGILQGTIEELKAPVAPPAQASQSASLALPVALVVEDNREMNSFITDNLRGEFIVHCAFDGEEGLRKAHEYKPDLIISDVMMPRMSGDRMIELLRQERAFDRVPVLILSAKADDELRLRLLANGAQDYLVKPFAAQELITRSRNLALAKRSQEQLASLVQKLDAEAREQTTRLNASEARFRTITNAMPQMVWTAEPDGYPVYFSEQWYDFTGLPNGSLVGHKWAELMHEDDSERVWEVWREALASGRMYEVEFRLRHKSGQHRWVLARATPVSGEDGAVVHWMGTSTDIDVHKRNEQALRDADRRKDEFLAMLAHELRNPLAPIGAASDLLSMARLDPERIRVTSEVIGRQVRHMTGLIDELLDVSRVTRGLVTLDRAELDMKVIIGEAVEQVQPLIESQRHHLTVDVAPEHANVLGDHKRLVQIAVNLLVNSAKYTPPGGHIRLGMAVPDGHVVLTVQDNGIGIEPDLQPRVFELFSQGQRKSDRSQGGLGIGLALVRSLVDLHGGKVECFSEGPGRGSTFTVTLPRHMTPAAAEPAQAGPSAETRRASLRILLVDDNVDAACMLAMLLEAAGHEVAVEHASLLGLERARRERPDVCLLDIGLPDVDGKELARRLKAAPETSGVVLIAVTGYGQEHDRDSAFEAGFDHHLVKPVDCARLMRILDELRASPGRSP